MDTQMAGYLTNEIKCEWSSVAVETKNKSRTTSEAEDLHRSSSDGLD